MIKCLEPEFEGIAEVNEFKFKQINYSDKAYLYQVYSFGTDIHYEIFARKNTPICVDFENRIYSETDFKEIYPKSKDFGVWAWTKNNLCDAINLFNKLSNNE